MTFIFYSLFSTFKFPYLWHSTLQYTQNNATKEKLIINWKKWRKRRGSGNEPWTNELPPCIQLLFVPNWFKQYSLLATFSTCGSRCFKIRLHFPRSTLLTSCLTELQHIHFSCSNMFAKTEGSDFNKRFYYVYIPLPWTCLFLLPYTSSFISWQVDNILATKQFTITQAKHSDTHLWRDHVYNFKKRGEKHIKDTAFILSMSKIQVYLKPRQETLIKSGFGMIYYKQKSEMSYPVFFFLLRKWFDLPIALLFTSLQNLDIYMIVKGFQLFFL